MADKCLKTAVVGSGAISDIYIKNMICRFTNLEVVSICSKHLENAQKKADVYGIQAFTYEEILRDPAIDIVVILTPVPTHYDLIRAALLSGKHVYTEKVMTLALDQAAELSRLADEKHLYLGAAPDTFLGSALQTARKALDDGLIGDVTSFDVSANRDLDYLASKYNFLCQSGGGICFDYGVYYLTALVSLLGPMLRTAAIVKNKRPVRVNKLIGSPQYGQEFAYDNESQVSAILETASGISGAFSLNGDSVRRDLSFFYIYGTKGMLKLTNPDNFGGEVTFIPNPADDQDAQDALTLENHFDFSEDSRGIGVAEMADAIINGRVNRANKAIAYHVLDVIHQMMASSQDRRFVEIHSACEAPSPFYPADACAFTAG